MIYYLNMLDKMMVNCKLIINYKSINRLMTCIGDYRSKFQSHLKSSFVYCYVSKRNIRNRANFHSNYILKWLLLALNGVNWLSSVP